MGVHAVQEILVDRLALIRVSRWRRWSRIRGACAVVAAQSELLLFKRRTTPCHHRFHRVVQARIGSVRVDHAGFCSRAADGHSTTSSVNGVAIIIVIFMSPWVTITNNGAVNVAGRALWRAASSYQQW